MDNNTLKLIKKYVDTKVSSNYSSGDISLNSPAFTGIPTAPTASFGTNTNQLATTAFVQQAITPTLLITISNMPSNETSITATASLNNSNYQVSNIINSSGVTVLTLDFLGDYTITFNNPSVKSNSSITIALPKAYTLSGYWAETATYTINIDTTNSNSETACTYADDALGMTKGSSHWDSLPIFKDIKPCVFSSGSINYYLNPNDWTKKIDGTSSVLTGEDGDVMIEFPKFAYKIKTVDNIITVSVSTDPTVIANDSDYTYDAFSRLEEGDLAHFYKGAFLGVINNSGQLRSIAGVKPTGEKTIAEFRAAAQANGPHYQQATYAQTKAIQCLYLIKYGNLDGQATIGQGATSNTYASRLITGYNSTNTNSLTSPTFSLGMTFGDTSLNYVHMRLFGLEDFWGVMTEFIDGLTTDNNRNIITSWNSFSNEGITATTISTASGFSSNQTSGDFVTKVIGNTAAGFIGSAYGGSSSTYWADKNYFSNNCVAKFSGHYGSGTSAGPFFFDINADASGYRDNVGARLSYV